MIKHVRVVIVPSFKPCKQTCFVYLTRTEYFKKPFYAKMHEMKNYTTIIMLQNKLFDATGFGLAAGALNAKGKEHSKRSLIQRENAKPGTRDWLLTNPRTLPGKINNNPAQRTLPLDRGLLLREQHSGRGESSRSMVSTNPASVFKLEIFRTGYYNGDGARRVKTFDGLEGKPQPDPPIGENYIRECAWEPSVEFEIPDDWLSGVYLGKLTAEKENIQSYVIFIVRDDRPCDFLFQCSDLTWSAYNRWPADYSIYTPHEKGYSTTGVPSGTVSFDRPYALFTHPVNRVKTSGGSGEYLPLGIPPRLLDGTTRLRRLLHFQYRHPCRSGWPAPNQGIHLRRARRILDQGNVPERPAGARRRREPGLLRRELRALRRSPAALHRRQAPPGRPPRRLVHARPKKIPEAQLRKLLNRDDFELNMGPDGAQLMGGRLDTGQSTGRGMGSGDWTCATPGHWLFEGTGMKLGDSIKGLLGWEWHGAPAMDLPGMTVVAEGDATINGKTVGRYSSTLYDGPKDNVVFNAATIWWANGLSSPPGMSIPSGTGSSSRVPTNACSRSRTICFDGL